MSCLSSQIILISHILIVDGGTRAVIFDKISGVQQKVIGEGTHFKIPFIQVGMLCLHYFIVDLGNIDRSRL